MNLNLCVNCKYLKTNKYNELHMCTHHTVQDLVTGEIVTPFILAREERSSVYDENGSRKTDTRVQCGPDGVNWELAPPVVVEHKPKQSWFSKIFKVKS